MRRDDEIVVLNNKIAYGTRRQIQSQRLPVGAVIERDVNASFCSGEQHAFLFRICANRVDDLAGRYSVRKLCPRFSAVLCRKNVRPTMGDPDWVYRCVSGGGIEMRGLHQR